MVVREVSELGDLSKAEEQVLAELDTGEDIVLGDGSVPETGDDGRRVHAALIRLLLLGDDPDPKCRLHEKGLRIRGAWIPDRLDLEGCRGLRDVGLLRCRFEEMPVLRSAEVLNLNLTGSRLPGLFADGLEAKGDVILRGADATGAVRLVGAKLGGDLDCTGARFRAERNAQGNQGDGLSAEGLEARGSVFLRGIEAAGAVRLPGAKLSVDLDCSGAMFRAEKDAQGGSGDALCLVGATIGGTFFLRNGACIGGILDLTAAEIGTVCDAAGCWPGYGDLLLDRCRYGAFIRRSPVDATSRLDWLDRQDPTLWGEEFWPQPYEQLAKVLREMGHGEEARKVLIAKERLHRAARRARAAPVLRPALSVWDAILGATVRYGRQPLWAFVWLLGFWLYGVVVFSEAESAGVLKPNAPVFLRSTEWADCAADASSVSDPRAQIDCFLSQPTARSYPLFNKWAYSADTLLPIVSLEMQGYWIPDDRKGWAGWGARLYLWIHIAVGWALSLLAVAGFSGLVKSD